MKQFYVFIVLLVALLQLSVSVKAEDLSHISQAIDVLVNTKIPEEEAKPAPQPKAVVPAKNACPNTSFIKAKSIKAHSNRGYIIYIGNKQAMWFMKDVGNIPAEKRAKIVENSINRILSQGINPATIKPVKEGNYTYLKAGNQKIVTVDEVNAKAMGVSVHELAYTWANNTRVALGTYPLRKDYSDVSRGFSGKESRYIGHKSTGMASWYGPAFHGRRSSDGSRFNKEEYTAAHRTYPFGTLVKVTNLKNSKSCVVKITDRGPYAHGRIIDLSKKAAEEIGMLGSGVAKVRLEVVGQY